MKCSRCWLWEHGCLDERNRVDANPIGRDKPCRAMRAVMKLAGKLGQQRYIVPGTDDDTSADGWARWATR